MNYKSEIEQAMIRAREKLAESVKNEEWHECFQTALGGHVYDKDLTMLLMIHNGTKIWCFKMGDKFEVTERNDNHCFYVWEKWFIFYWKRTRFTFQETLNLLAEINVAGKATTFEVET